MKVTPIDFLSPRSILNAPYPQFDDWINGWKLIAIAVEGDFAPLDEEDDSREAEWQRLGLGSASLGGAA